MQTYIILLLFIVSFIFTLAFLVHVCWLSGATTRTLRQIKKEMDQELAALPTMLKNATERSQDLLVGGLTHMTEQLDHTYHSVYSRENEDLINAIDRYTDATTKILRDELNLHRRQKGKRPTHHRTYHKLR